MGQLRLSGFPPPQSEALRLVAQCITREAAYLVGGAVRDALLGRWFDDLDLAVSSGAAGLARRVAERGGGTYVELDAERGAARAVLRAAGVTVQVDVTDFRGPTLADDLAGRDFAVNALAVPLRGLVEGVAAVVGPREGLADLRARRLRLAAPDSIARDPARALRGVRLEAELGFRLDAAAGRAIRREAVGLRRVSPERIGQEIAAILRLGRSASAVRRAERLGVLGVVIPETAAMRGVTQPAPHRFDVLDHSLRALLAADRLLSGIGELAPWTDLLAGHLAEPVGGGLTRREVLKLAALLHDVAKPETRAVVDGRIRFFGHDGLGAERVRAIGERLRLASSATRVLETLVRHHLRPMHLEQAGHVTRRARYRFFRDLGDQSRDLLLLTLVDAAAVRGSSPFTVWRRSGLVRELMAGWEEDRASRTVSALLRGEDVMTTFGLGPGPEVGRLLEHAREAQDTGVVATREQALEYLRAARQRERVAQERGSVL
jgi:poly(A) polymerase